jgi:hypothetical protein
MALTESRKMKCESALNILIEDWLWEEQAPQIQKVSDRLEHLKPTKKELMISKVISGAACLAELTSNPKSFYNCPDLHGGVPGLPGDKICMKPVLGKKRRDFAETASAVFQQAMGIKQPRARHPAQRHSRSGRSR